MAPVLNVHRPLSCITKHNLHYGCSKDFWLFPSPLKKHHFWMLSGDFPLKRKKKISILFFWFLTVSPDICFKSPQLFLCNHAYFYLFSPHDQFVLQTHVVFYLTSLKKKKLNKLNITENRSQLKILFYRFIIYLFVIKKRELEKRQKPGE